MLPVLESDGRVLPQSNAQLRYVGKLAGKHNVVVNGVFRRLRQRVMIITIVTVFGVTTMTHGCRLNAATMLLQ